MKTTKKILWKLFPNTLYDIFNYAHTKGIKEGRESERRLIESRLREHDLKDFDEPALILGYTHAVKAMRGELYEVV